MTLVSEVGLQHFSVSPSGFHILMIDYISETFRIKLDADTIHGINALGAAQGLRILVFVSLPEVFTFKASEMLCRHRLKPRVSMP